MTIGTIKLAAAEDADGEATDMIKDAEDADIKDAEDADAEDADVRAPI